MALEQIGLEAVLQDENFQAGLQRYMSGLGKAGGATEKAASGMTAFGHTMSTAVGSAIGYLTGQAIPALISGLGGLVKGALSGNAEFERYNAQFTTLLGSADAAKERLDKLAEFGAKTPFELPQVVQADKILQGFGLHSKEAAQKFGFSGEDILTIAGDVASGTGADFQEMSLMLGKFSAGATGEAMARMAEMGIASKDDLAKMGLEFSKSGELLSPLPKAMNVVLTLMKTKYGGLMDAQSKTFEGMMSNLSDWWGQTKRKIAEPIFNVVKDNLGKLLEFLGSPVIQSAITGLAEGLSKSLAGVMPVVQDFATFLMEALQTLSVSTPGQFAEWLGIPPEIVAGIQDFASTMGEMAKNLMPTFTKLSQKIGDSLAKVAKDVVPFLVKQFAKLGDWFKENRPLIEKFIKLAAEKFGDLAVAVLGAWNVIKPILGGLIDIILDVVKLIMAVATGDWPAAWEAIKKVVQDAWNAIKAASVAFGNWVASWMGTTLDGIRKQWSDNWEMFKVIVSAAWTSITQSISNAITAISNAVSSGFTAIRNLISQTWAAIQADVTTAWQSITSTIYNAIAAIPGAVQDAIASVIEIGTNIVNTIEEGIISTWNTITSWVSGALSGFASAVWNSDIAKSIIEVGNNIIYCIRSGVSTAWGAVGGVIEKMQELLGGFWESVKDSMSSIIATGAGIVEAIKQGIVNNWNNFVNWLKGLIGGIFGGGGSGSYGANGLRGSGVVAGSFGQQAMATQYSSSVVNTNTFILQVSTVAPVSTVVQDFHTMQSLAAV